MVKGAQLQASWSLGMRDYERGTWRNLAGIVVSVTGSHDAMHRAEDAGHVDDIRIAYGHGRATAREMSERRAMVRRVRSVI